ncbi:MAG: enoyl-CoA hydratase/isomerase family protein [Thermoanaerobaculales bacterium]
MIDVLRRERVVHLVINAPPVNVLDSAILSELVERLGELESDESVAAVVLSGEGRCFSAGASVAEHKQDQAKGMLTALSEACLALPAFPAPVVATIHGACLGGALELVAFCDFVVVAPDATLGQPEIKLAFFPPVACHKLPRLIGFQNAAYTILSGENLTADQALAMGLVQKILPKDEWAQIDDLFNGLSAPVLRITKQALTESVDRRPAERLEVFNEMFMSKLFGLEDVAEGIASFEERRAPAWKHR